MIKQCALLSLVAASTACMSPATSYSSGGPGSCGSSAHLFNGNCVENGPDAGTSPDGGLDLDGGSDGGGPPAIGPNVALPCLQQANIQGFPLVSMTGDLATGFPTFASLLEGGDESVDNISNGFVSGWGLETFNPDVMLSDGGDTTFSGGVFYVNLSSPQPLSAGASATFPATYACDDTPPGEFFAWAYGPPASEDGFLCPLAKGVQPYASANATGQTCGSGFVSTVNVVEVAPDGGFRPWAVVTFSEICATTGASATGCLYVGE